MIMTYMWVLQGQPNHYKFCDPHASIVVLTTMYMITLHSYANIAIWQKTIISGYTKNVNKA